MKNKKQLLGILILTGLLHGPLVGEESLLAYQETRSSKNQEDIIQIQPDGTKIIKTPDNTFIQIRPDGTKKIQKADGSFIEKRPDGTKIIKKPDGFSIQINPDGSRIMRNPDGSQLDE